MRNLDFSSARRRDIMGVDSKGHLENTNLSHIITESKFHILDAFFMEESKPTFKSQMEQ